MRQRLSLIQRRKFKRITSKLVLKTEKRKINLLADSPNHVSLSSLGFEWQDDDKDDVKNVDKLYNESPTSKNDDSKLEFIERIKIFNLYIFSHSKGEEDPSRIIRFPDSSDFLNVSNKKN